MRKKNRKIPSPLQVVSLRDSGALDVMELEKYRVVLDRGGYGNLTHNAGP